MLTDHDDASPAQQAAARGRRLACAARRQAVWLAVCGFALGAAQASAGCRRTAPVPSEGAASIPAPPAVVSPATSSAGAAAPAGYIDAHVFRVVETSQGDAVLLADNGEKRFLPIFVGGTEALSIKLRHEKQRYPRPLTHDLLDTLVDKLGGRIVRVQVDSIKNRVYIGRVYVVRADGAFDVDARPSDAIALALGSGAPILVAGAVFDQAALTAEDLGLGKQPDELRVPERGRPDEPTQL